MKSLVIFRDFLLLGSGGWVEDEVIEVVGEATGTVGEDD